MDRIGLINSVYEAAANIDSGRKGVAARGKAEEGRITYELGISKAMTAFQKASATYVAASTGGTGAILRESSSVDVGVVYQ